MRCDFCETKHDKLTRIAVCVLNSADQPAEELEGQRYDLCQECVGRAATAFDNLMSDDEGDQ